MRVWPNEVPFDGKPKHTYEIIKSYGEWLLKTDLPKLFFYANPGGILKKENVEWVKNNFSNLKSVDIGEGIHFVQEDNPHLIGSELSKWYQTLFK